MTILEIYVVLTTVFNGQCLIFNCITWIFGWHFKNFYFFKINMKCFCELQFIMIVRFTFSSFFQVRVTLNLIIELGKWIFFFFLSCLFERHREGNNDRQTGPAPQREREHSKCSPWLGLGQSWGCGRELVVHPRSPMWVSWTQWLELYSCLLSSAPAGS